VTRWRQRIVRFYLLRWRDNAKFARQLKASWAKLESRITQRHVEDGFLGWARYTAERKRTLILLDVSTQAHSHPELHGSPFLTPVVCLQHAVRRWRKARLQMSLDGWVDNIRLRRAHASALDKFTSRSVFAQLCATFYGWLGTLEDEKRSRWVAVRVERNSAKVLMSACIGHWRIESRALARARRRKAEEEAALDRAQRREADRVAILNDMSELLKRRRHQGGGSPAENSVRPLWSRCLVYATVLRGARLLSCMA